MGKRANGEGSIYKRKGDGRYCGTLTIEGEKRKSYYGATRQEVSRKLNDALKSHREGLPLPAERQTVGEFLATWLDSTRSSVRPGTIRGYESKARVHLIPGLGRVSLIKLTPQRLELFLAEKLDSGLSPRTVQHLRAIIRAALTDATKWGLVARNVASLVDGPRVPHSEVRPLTPTEAQTLLEAVKGDRLEALYSVALAMGLRQGEALGLRWEAVELNAGTLTVSTSLQRLKGEFYFAEPKTSRSRRTIALPEIVTSALRAHRARQLAERLAAGPLWQEHGLIFTRANGAPLHGSNVTRDFQRLLGAAGLRRMTFHELRHACASLLAAQGVHPRVIMETLGHSNIAITMNLYSHVLPETQRHAAATMDAALGGGA